MIDLPPPALVLDLVAVDPDRIRGIYTIGGKLERLPARALWLHPEAAASIDDEMAGWITVSDMFRSPESSLAAVRSGRGARPPGYSAHNYGLAIDLDVGKTMRSLRTSSKIDLDRAMSTRGWLCHRIDGKITSLKGESHHYNYLGPGYENPRGATSTAAAIEARIVRLYGAAWRTIDPRVAQAQLARLGLYHGDLDGKIGPISCEAIRAFRRCWGLPDGARIDAQMYRTLVYVAAGRR